MNSVLIPHPAETAALFGHEDALERFRRARARGRMPHAWALSGAGGIGKATLAWHMAREWLAPEAERGRCHDPESPLFRQLRERAHPELQVLDLESQASARAREIPVAAVRDLVARLHRTGYGGRRVVLIDAADDLNRHAANALLKVLEEPPPGTLFLLVCHEPAAIPATILSRCLRLPLRPLGNAELMRALEQMAPDLDPEARRRLAAVAGGRLGHALRLARAGFLDLYARLLDQLAAKHAASALEAAAALAPLARDWGIAFALTVPQEILRRAVRLGLGLPLEPELTAGEAAKLAAILRRLPLEEAAGLWEKFLALARQTESLHLDPEHSLVVALATIRGDATADALGREF